MFSWLLDEGSDMSVTSNDGSNVGHFAARGGNVGIMKLVVEAIGTESLSVKDGMGNDVVSTAISSRNVNVLEYLVLEQNVKVDKLSASELLRLSIHENRINLVQWTCEKFDFAAKRLDLYSVWRCFQV